MSVCLSLVGVDKGFSRGGEWVPVLADVSLEVMPGEIAAVIGGRLEGKTTLLKIAAGLERPDKGTIHLHDQQITNTPDQQRSRLLSRQSRLLGQQIRWIDRGGPGLKIETTKFVGWPLTLHGYKRRQAEQTAAQALARVGATQCAGRHWTELSNWQRVLVGLARAFVANPQLIIIDDLLDALGTKATEQASDLIRTLIEDANPHPAILMSASDLESAIYADNIHTLTHKHTLKPISRPGGGGAKIVAFPQRNSSKDAGARGVGCS
jgi:ABC-type lipoprotein export system ATPase subunit